MYQSSSGGEVGNPPAVSCEPPNCTHTAFGVVDSSELLFVNYRGALPLALQFLAHSLFLSLSFIYSVYSPSSNLFPPLSPLSRTHTLAYFSLPHSFTFDFSSAVVQLIRMFLAHIANAFADDIDNQNKLLYFVLRFSYLTSNLNVIIRSHLSRHLFSKLQTFIRNNIWIASSCGEIILRHEPEIFLLLK